MKKKYCSLKWIHFLTIVIGTVFISLSIFHENLWFDETYSIGISKHSIADIWTIGGNDVHPVLYYWILHGLMLLFPNCYIIVFRLFSVLCISAIGVLGYTHIKKDFGEKTGLLFSFFSFFMAEMAHYANEIRMYSWTALTVTVCAIYAYRIYKGESNVKNWIILFLSSIFSLYSHYYGLLAAGMLHLFLLIHFIKEKKTREIKTIIISGIIQALLYLPWLLYFLKQVMNVSGGFWIGFSFPDTIYELLFFQMTGVLNREYCAIIIAVIYVIIAWVIRKMIKEKVDLSPAKLASYIILGVVAATLVMTAVMTQMVLYYRYLFVLIGLFIFMLSYVLARCNRKWIVASVCIVTALLGILNCHTMIKTNYSQENEKVISYLEENVKPEDQIIYCQIRHVRIATKVNNTNQVFYNEEDWGVEEAYKAYSPNMETIVKLPDPTHERIWVIDDKDLTLYSSVYADNENYDITLSKEFAYEPYSGNKVTVVLLERVAN